MNAINMKKITWNFSEFEQNSETGEDTTDKVVFDSEMNESHESDVNEDESSSDESDIFIPARKKQKTEVRCCPFHVSYSAIVLFLFSFFLRCVSFLWNMVRV